PIGLDDSTPPAGFHGMSPSIAVAPASVSFQPSFSPQNPRFSSHIGSYQANGTYTSPQSSSLRGPGMPACRHASPAPSLPPCGLTLSRPANMIGSDRIGVPCTHAGGFGAFLAAPSEARTMAHAPPDDGHVSRYRIGSHSIGVDSTISREMPGIFRW